MTDPRPEIRVYNDPDRAACLSLFDTNTPDFFDPDEREEFMLYLDDLSERGPNAEYLVLVAGASVLACGGLYVTENLEAGLAWGMVARDHHGAGLGKRLLLERLRRIARRANVRAVVLDTSQRSSGFFERFGFQVVRVTEDGYGEGLHRVDMKLELNAEARARILETT